MVTEINSVVIPAEFVELAEQWYDGSGSMMYAIASTGGLRTGDRRPLDEDGSPMPNGQWYWSLWTSLASELRYLLRSTFVMNDENRRELTSFREWAESIADRLESEYRL